MPELEPNVAVSDWRSTVLVGAVGIESIVSLEIKEFCGVA
jgi:hypothetical protein